MKFTNEERYRCFDRADWYFEYALKAYCQLEKKLPAKLDDNDYNEIYRCAGNHTGLFLTWIIKNNFIGEIHKDNKYIEDVRSDKMSGIDFLMSFCDGKFCGEDVSDEIFPFVHYYYTNERYFSDYKNWVLNELYDIPFEFVSTYEDYYEFEHIINEKFDYFRNIN